MHEQSFCLRLRENAVPVSIATFLVGVQDGGSKKVALSGLSQDGSCRDAESLEAPFPMLPS